MKTNSFYAQIFQRPLLSLCLLTAGLVSCSEGNDPSIDQPLATDSGEALAPLLDGIGDHHFEITTDNELTQRFFDQGLTFAYAFNHQEAERAFREAARLDPNCLICYWGIALVLGPNFNAPMPEENNDPAWQAISKGLDLLSMASAKEEEMLLALANRYRFNHSGDRKELDEAYVDAMAALASAHSMDADILTLYAEAMMDLYPWALYDNDANPAAHTQAIVDALEMALAINPKHPGALHYLIHALEPSKNPEQALLAADTLQPLVPVSGHLVHMPSHIYIRTGDYEKAIRANQEAVAADETYVSQCMVQGFSADPYYPHNLHFLWYAALMDGRKELALQSATEMYNNSEQAAYTAIPLFTRLRFGMWQDTLDEATRISSSAAERISGAAVAAVHFSQVVASAKLGDADGATAHYEQLRETLDDDAASGVEGIYLHVAQAMIAEVNGNAAEKVVHLEMAVAMQDALPYFEPPQFFMPLRQALGMAYIQAGDPESAAAQFVADNQENPGNGWSLFGLREARKAANDSFTATLLNSQVDQSTANFTFELGPEHFL